MKIKFLGTAAAEGIPGLFCSCAFCESVRNGKDRRDFRTRSQSLINDDLLVDFNEDSLYHSIKNKLNFGDIRYLLVTHSHSDHFFPQEFVHRDGRGHGRELKYPDLEIYCNENVKKVFESIAPLTEMTQNTKDRLKFNILKPFDKIKFGDYTVTALKANHKLEEDAFVYLIEEGGKTLFYCNDTGVLSESVTEYLKGVRIDLAQLDCTMVDVSSIHGHMGYKQCVELKDTLTTAGALTKKSVVVVNHFSHNNCLKYEEFEKKAAKDGMLVSYDGMEIEF